MSQRTGTEALAQGLRKGGVQVVTSYPGSPCTGVVHALLRDTAADEMVIQWAANEKVAVEVALGASLGGARSAALLKGVGLNIALDPLQTANLTGCPTALVLLVGDDPGAVRSQNEQDSRLLVRALELPLLEPRHPGEAAWAAREAVRLSESFQLPVFVRITRRLAEAVGPVPALQSLPPTPPRMDPPLSIGWNSSSPTAVAYHVRLHQRLLAAQREWDRLQLVDAGGEGTRAVLLVGALDLLRPSLARQRAPLRWLSLGASFPLPDRALWEALEGVTEVLVVEETDALVEEQLAAAAQRLGRRLRVWGRATGHLPPAGALDEDTLEAALAGLREERLPDWRAPEVLLRHRTFCEGCPYDPIMRALRQAIDGSGRRVAVTAEPGCGILAAYRPYQLLTAKYSMGSALSIAQGLALGGAYERVVALCGDSAFFHSGVSALLSAVQHRGQVLAVVLDNASTALTGQQPHAGSGRDARGEPAPAPTWEVLLPACGVRHWEIIPAHEEAALQRAFRAGLAADDLRVVVARGPCILLPEAPASPRWRELPDEEGSEPCRGAGV